MKKQAIRENQQNQVSATSHKKWGIILAVTVVILAVLGSAFYYSKYHHKQEVQQQFNKASQAVKTAAADYIAGRKTDVWLLEHAAESEPEKAMRLSAEMKRKFESILASYRDVGITSEIANMFSGKFFVSFFTEQKGGASVYLDKDPILMTNDQLEVVIYSKQHRQHPFIHNNFARYDPNWSALILGGIKLTEAWEAGLVMHELNHARHDREKAASSHAPPLSDLWIEEELESHELERKVLNRAVQGKYEVELEAVVKEKDAKNLTQLYSRITGKDLRRFDALFGEPSEMEAAIRAAQMLVDISQTWIDQNIPPERREAKRIETYRYLFQLWG